MISILEYLIDSASFVPHAVCLLWRPDLLAMHGLSDFFIAAAYLTIPVFIVRASRARPDLVNTKVAWMFATFITACALSHLAGLLTLWFPYYGLQGLIKVLTACVSLYTAYQLARLAPTLLTLPSREQLAERDAELIVRAREAEESQKINQKLDEFAYLAAHDLRAPLRSLKLISGWIEEDLREPDAAETTIPAHMDRLRSQVDRMDAMIVDLLEYSKIGHGDVVPEDIDTIETIASVVKFLAPPEGFVTDIDSDLPVLHLARAEFELVIRNIIGNAIKHHDRACGKISVRGLGWENDGYGLEFEGDGPGIPERDMARIFEKFAKLKSKDEDIGSGLGLAAVIRVLENTGGSISVRNGESGRGAIFTLTLKPAGAKAPALVA